MFDLFVKTTACGGFPNSEAFLRAKGLVLIQKSKHYAIEIIKSTE